LRPYSRPSQTRSRPVVDRQRRTPWRGRGKITLTLYFAGLLNETRTLERIEISDNGIGFNDANYERFVIFLDRSKGFNNRGSQFLHFARRIEVTSNFMLDGKAMRRHFLCNPNTYITDPSVVPADPDTDLGTTLVLSDFALNEEGKAYFSDLTLVELRNGLKSHFLLRLHLARVENPDAAPIIHLGFVKNGKPEEPLSLEPSDIPEPQTRDISAPYVKVKDALAEDIEWLPQPGHVETLHWAQVKTQS
jgi:hypothetical protein